MPMINSIAAYDASIIFFNVQSASFYNLGVIALLGGLICCSMIQSGVVRQRDSRILEC